MTLLKMGGSRLTPACQHHHISLVSCQYPVFSPHLPLLLMLLLIFFLQFCDTVSKLSRCAKYHPASSVRSTASSRCGVVMSSRRCPHAPFSAVTSNKPSQGSTRPDLCSKPMQMERNGFACSDLHPCGEAPRGSVLHLRSKAQREELLWLVKA